MFWLAYPVLSIGEIATIVVGIQNNGNANYNITAIFGSLNSPFNSKMFIQNVSRPFVFYRCSSILVCSD